MTLPPFFNMGSYSVFSDLTNEYQSQQRYTRTEYRQHTAGRGDPFRDKVRRTTARRAHERIKSVAEYTLLGFGDEIIRTLGSEVVGGEVQFWDAMKEAINSKKTLTDAHYRAAEHAQAVMIDTYLRNVQNVKGKAATEGADALRTAKSRRYGGGILLRALENGNFFAAGPYGIRFGNLETLSVAPQWKRLNYGAGPRGRKGDENLQRFINQAEEGSGYVAPYSPTRGRGGQYQSFLTKALGSMASQLQKSPEPKFKVPRGIWIDRSGKPVAPGQSNRGTDAFVPASPEAVKRLKAHTAARSSKVGEVRREGNFLKGGRAGIHRQSFRGGKGRGQLMFQPETWSQGIASRKFIDAGLVAMVAALGKEYEAIWDQWLTIAGVRSHPKSGNFTQKPRGPASRVPQPGFAQPGTYGPPSPEGGTALFPSTRNQRTFYTVRAHTTLRNTRRLSS